MINLLVYLRFSGKGRPKLTCLIQTLIPLNFFYRVFRVIVIGLANSSYSLLIGCGGQRKDVIGLAYSKKKNSMADTERCKQFSFDLLTWKISYFDEKYPILCFILFFSIITIKLVNVQYFTALFSFCFVHTYITQNPTD